jgi:phosphohistidine phosphatase
MKTLCIIRHAKASHGEPLQPDHDRPLEDRGRSDAAVMGRMLRERGLLPDTILSSTAARAKTTAAILARELEREDRVLLLDDLYDASPRVYRRALAELPGDAGTAFLVGHNPELTAFCEEMTARRFGSIPTCGIVCIDLPCLQWDELNRGQTGSLRFLEAPKQFRA